MKNRLAGPTGLIASGLLILASLVFFALGGLKFGIDFTGGSILQVRFSDQRPTNDEIRGVVEGVLSSDAVIQPVNETTVVIRTEVLDQPTHDIVIAALSGSFGAMTEESFSAIGPTIGKELQDKAVVAIIVVLLAIIVYISWAFRGVSRGPVPAWGYGLSAILALIHDIVLTTGVFAALGYFFNIQIDALFATALLTILGFSVHDTIVVFDRIRSRLKKFHDEPFEQTIHESIRSTAIRSLNTSLTTLLVLVALLLFGGTSIRWFLVALICGITFGTYSSVFIASPLLVILRNARGK